MSFYNHLTQQYEPECTEAREPAPGSLYGVTRWYIKMGFPGFNTKANNGGGYSSKADAEWFCRYYQVKEPKDVGG